MPSRDKKQSTTFDEGVPIEFEVDDANFDDCDIGDLRTVRGGAKTSSKPHTSNRRRHQRQPSVRIETLNGRDFSDDFQSNVKFQNCGQPSSAIKSTFEQQAPNLQQACGGVPSGWQTANFNVDGCDEPVKVSWSVHRTPETGYSESLGANSGFRNPQSFGNFVLSGNGTVKPFDDAPGGGAGGSESTEPKRGDPLFTWPTPFWTTVILLLETKKVVCGTIIDGIPTIQDITGAVKKIFERLFGKKDKPEEGGEAPPPPQGGTFSFYDPRQFYPYADANCYYPSYNYNVGYASSCPPSQSAIPTITRTASYAPSVGQNWGYYYGQVPTQPFCGPVTYM